MDISASGLYAQKKRMEIVAQNIANADTVITDNLQPYQRKVALMAESKLDGSFSKVLTAFSAPMEGSGVSLQVEDAKGEAFKLEYNPEHPLADEDGYVRRPNIDTTEEMIEMLSATRAYEANATVMEATKSLFTRAMRILE
jgi:flagellar basal-body rod protein FlgC